jgi:hypothetical protein
MLYHMCHKMFMFTMFMFTVTSHHAQCEARVRAMRHEKFLLYFHYLWNEMIGSTRHPIFN